ncbi:hypothetical protein CF319_g9162 [Tilletia indica]|nr:hypothetical protein CF319_g9162 [Tilletia indica]
MRPHPDQLASGVFSRAVIIDMLVYVCVMGVTCRTVFIAMTFDVGGVGFGFGCKGHTAAVCDAVFQARSTNFVALIVQSLFLAWELISMHQFFFAMYPWRHLSRNLLLPGSVLFGLALVPICLQTSGFNDRIFRHGLLRGEAWGIALPSS